jgi:hypothetical protein
MNSYTNFAFLDGDSLVVLERHGDANQSVFSPLANAIKNAGAGRPSADVAMAVFKMMITDTASEWSLADTIRRNDRKVVVVDIRNDQVALYNATESNIGDKIFSMTITEFVTKYGDK